MKAKKRRRVKRAMMPEPQSEGSAIMQFIRCALVWCPKGSRVARVRLSKGAMDEFDSHCHSVERICLGGKNYRTVDGVSVVRRGNSKAIRVKPVYVRVAP